MNTFCQTEDCMATADVWVVSSAGWYGIHCEVCAGRVVQISVRQCVNGGYVIAVLPFTIEGWKGVNQLLKLSGSNVEGLGPPLYIKEET